MGIGRKILNSAIHHPLLTGGIATLVTLPYSYQLFKDVWKNDATDWEEIRWGFPPLACFLSVSFAAATLRCFFTEEEWRTRSGDNKIRKNLEAKLGTQTPPSLFIRGSKEVSYSFFDVYRNYFIPVSTVARRAKESRNPLMALDAVMRTFYSQDKYDEGLLLLRDAIDMLDGNKPELTFSSRMQYFAQNIELGYYYKFAPRRLATYMNSAARDAILNPEHAWYWSTLGKMIADEFKLEHRTEMYVFHAMLATAQRRSDIGEAWKDAFSVLKEQPVWERLGETRSIVRVLKNNKFFSNTLVFKARESREALIKEAEAGATLAALVENVDVPQPLYITQEPYEGKYVSIMRRLKGDTLYERLKANDKKSIPLVISTLAKIHARYPTEKYQRLDIKKNLEEKLKSPDFNISSELSDRIMANYAPVHEAIIDGALWVWNKDAHPENWIIGDKIGIIDNEGEYLIPALFDLVNLQEYGDFFLEKEKQSNINQYMGNMHAEGKKIRIGTASRAYRNSVIHRAIALTSAWSSPDRIRMHIYRKQTIRKAMYAIDETMREDKQYYEHHKDKYLHLHKAFQELHYLIPS